MKSKIKEFVKELFDAGMTQDEIIDAVSSAADQEAFIRFVKEHEDED